MVQLVHLPKVDVGENRIQKILEDKGGIMITQTIRLVISTATDSSCFLLSKDRSFSFHATRIDMDSDFTAADILKFWLMWFCLLFHVKIFCVLVIFHLYFRKINYRKWNIPPGYSLCCSPVDRHLTQGIYMMKDYCSLGMQYIWYCTVLCTLTQ